MKIIKTKIIATIGPKSSDYEIIKEMAVSGMDIVRLNFSHATKEQFFSIKENLARIEKEIGKKLLLMQDLQGPRIRVGIIPGGEIKLKEGEIYAFKYGDADISKNEISIDNEEIKDCVAPGDPFYLANGIIELTVLEMKDGKIFAKVERGGVLLSRKGINLPKTCLKSGGLTPKDVEDAEFGAKNGADMIALSFVQNKRDVEALRNVISKSEGKAKIIAKIERGVALKFLDEIIDVSDGIMVARGDLGIETPLEEIPIIQKNLIRHAHWYKKPAIVATEMLASMIEKTRPTRAEVADVANAIFDGADAVMLSDETASGHHPLEAVKTMSKIVEKADKHLRHSHFFEF